MTLVSYTSTRPLVQHLLVHDSHMTTQPLPPVVLPDTPFAKWSLGIDYSFGAHVYMNLQWVHGLADEFGADPAESDEDHLMAAVAGWLRSSGISHVALENG